MPPRTRARRWPSRRSFQRLSAPTRAAAMGSSGESGAPSSDTVTPEPPSVSSWRVSSSGAACKSAELRRRHTRRHTGAPGVSGSSPFSHSPESPVVPGSKPHRRWAPDTFVGAGPNFRATDTEFGATVSEAGGRRSGIDRVHVLRAIRRTKRWPSWRWPRRVRHQVAVSDERAEARAGFDAQGAGRVLSAQIRIGSRQARTSLYAAGDGRWTAAAAWPKKMTLFNGCAAGAVRAGANRPGPS